VRALIQIPIQDPVKHKISKFNQHVHKRKQGAPTNWVHFLLHDSNTVCSC
jgi:hypothetical protein